MKQENRRDVEKKLTELGFVLIRQTGHSIWANGNERVVLARDKYVSPGVMRSVNKVLKKFI